MVRESWFFLENAKEVRRVIANLLNLRVSITNSNKTNYNSKISLEAYSSYAGLKKPEYTILNLIKTILPIKMMLDVGVGAGRTTESFSSISDKYIGIDYSENMINFCKTKFDGTANISFELKDARNLSTYKNDTFDFVLFSHGGLDAVEHSDRIKILHEIWRVCKKGGYFCFSTSNLEAVSNYCVVRLSRSPKVLVRGIFNLLLVRLLNPEIWAYRRGKRPRLKHAMYIIGGDNWGLKTYCISPSEQIKQLQEANFEGARIFGSSGNEIKELINAEDLELYFLCRAIDHV